MGNETEQLGVILYFGAAGLILLGVYAMTALRHVVRVILGLGLVESGVNLALVAVGYLPGGAAPILAAYTPGQPLPPMVDPIVQALVLTSIVIGVGVLALASALLIRVYKAYGTFDMVTLSREIAAGGLPHADLAGPPLPLRKPASEEAVK